MKAKSLIVYFIAGMGLLLAPAAFAHTVGAHGAGFVAGLAHPLLGIDHLLAMLAVGLWAAQSGGGALWRVPAAFVAAMAGGALLANNTVESSLLETAIAGSVLALGLMVGFALRLPGLSGLLAVSLFALFHGYAHGLEMPQAASPWGYGLGFLLATSSLHFAGVLLGLFLGRRQNLLRAGGLAIATAGLWLLAA
ncbi:MAG: HupE/UreJ family protein [Methylococcaceae bacterium]|nr:HupE/UreJ family protein [Methylococcaceae bacterium]